MNPTNETPDNNAYEFDFKQLLDDANDLNRLVEQVEGQAFGLENETKKEANAIAKYLAHSDVTIDDGVRLDHLRTDNGKANYYLPIPLKVFPQHGTSIDMVEVSVFLNPAEEQDLPFINDLMPKPHWRETFRAEGSITVGINQALDFVALLPNEIGQASGLLKTLLGDSLENTGVSVPYKAVSRVPEIIVNGISGSNAQWRFIGTQLFESDTALQLGITFSLPLAARKLRVQRRVKARRINRSITALLAQDIERLSRVFQPRTDQKSLSWAEKLSEFARRLRDPWNIVRDDFRIWDFSADLRR